MGHLRPPPIRIGNLLATGMPPEPDANCPAGRRGLCAMYGRRPRCKRKLTFRCGRGRFVRSLPRYLGQVRLLNRIHRRLRPPAFPTTSRPRLAGTAMEISRFPCKRLLRMPGSTTTRGRHVSCDIDTRRVAFCGTENISTPNLSYAALYLACALPCERFTPALAGIPCITRGQCGSLLLHRDGLPPSTFCRSPGAPVHHIKAGRALLLGGVIRRRPGCGEDHPRFPM